MSSIVTFNNVTKNYNSVAAVSGLSFEIEENTFVALVGNNGCGKTTTTNILCNLTNYEAGEVTAFGKKVRPEYVSYKNQLGILLSKPYFIDEFNPREYLHFVCKFQKMDKSLVDERVRNILQLFEMEESSSKPIKRLSSGQQMKVSLAAALVHNPSMLIMDEPFVNLDIASTQKVMDILNEFRGKKTVFITSHNLDLVADLCDKFLIMEEGIISTTLYKQDLGGSDNLKEQVKQLLIKQGKKLDVSWLN